MQSNLGTLKPIRVALFAATLGSGEFAEATIVPPKAVKRKEVVPISSPKIVPT
jgi:hypothetical protein